MTVCPQVLVNVRVAERRDLNTFPGYATLVADFERRLGPQGRVLIRYSGTEPLLRVMLEGEDFHTISLVAEELADNLRTLVGAPTATGAA
jgi:phosphoglucosamine mutase